MKEITDEKLDKYFDITSRALDMAKKAPQKLELEGARKDMLVMPSISEARVIMLMLLQLLVMHMGGWMQVQE